MPQEFQHTHDLLSRRPRRDADSDPATMLESQKSEPSSATVPSGERDLAQFSLLADPTTISGNPTNDAGSDDPSRDRDEVTRLRAALHVQSREMAQLQRSTPDSPSRPDLDDANTSTSRGLSDGKLLNSIQARQLAEDAREREKAIRAELSSAQDAMRSETKQAVLESTPDRGGESRQRWQTHSLVRTRSAGDASKRPASSAREGVIDSDLTEHSLLLAANAEVRELRATLSIARKTTLGQKREIGELRKQLLLKIELLGASAPNDADEAFTATHQDLEQQLEASRTETSHLRERLRLSEMETEAHDAEMVILRSTLEQREGEISSRRRELDALKDRFDAQDRALNNARSQFEQERSQNTESQNLLAQLRRTLGQVCDPSLPLSPMEVTSQMRPVSDRTDADVDVDVDVDVPASLLFTDSKEDAVDGHQRPAEHEAGSLVAPFEDRGLSSFTRPPIFDAWQDDQIRRHFGPMGIDTIVDLLRAPLARRNESNLQPEQSILLIGRGAWRWAPTLAEGLIQNGTPSFTIYVCDPSSAGITAAESLPGDHPIQDYLQPISYPASAESLGDSLVELRPTALISRDFLSNEEVVEPWLDVLSVAANSGTCLLFSERTGITQNGPPAEIAAIGERIWGLMPDRYKNCEGAGGDATGPRTWSRALLESAAQSADGAPQNHLLARLRERFQLEMLAKFGFLAEPFVATPIGENFDKDASRDRKFLHQVSELDDQKIEAGIVPGLHLVAVVDQENHS